LWALGVVKWASPTHFGLTHHWPAKSSVGWLGPPRLYGLKLVTHPTTF